jgi:hypothetical protein
VGRRCGIASGIGERRSWASHGLGRSVGLLQMWQLRRGVAAVPRRLHGGANWVVTTPKILFSVHLLLIYSRP